MNILDGSVPELSDPEGLAWLQVKHLRYIYRDVSVDSATFLIMSNHAWRALIYRLRSTYDNADQPRAGGGGGGSGGVHAGTVHIPLSHRRHRAKSAHRKCTVISLHAWRMFDAPPQFFEEMRTWLADKLGHDSQSSGSEPEVDEATVGACCCVWREEGRDRF